MPTVDAWQKTFSRLFHAQNWADVAREAERAIAEHPQFATFYGHAAHALRQLGRLDEAFERAQRGHAIAPEDLYVGNRLTLLAALTRRNELAFEVACELANLSPATANDRQNLATAIGNGIHGAGQLGKIGEAIERFSPAIEWLDHAELHFNAACLYALGKDDRAFGYVQKALATGKAKAAFDDHDFDGIRSDPRFVELLARDWHAEQRALDRSRKASRDALVMEDFIDPVTFDDDDPQIDGERDPELERAIDRTPDDPEAYLVYADWLQQRDNPLGAFIQATRRCELARGETERMRAFADWGTALRIHAPRWFGAYAAYLDGKSRWRHGFLDKLVFDLGSSDGSTEDAGAMLAEVLRAPICRFVRAISVGDVWAYDQLVYAPIVHALVAADLPLVRALAIAPRVSQMSWTELDASTLVAKYRALESLELGGGALELGALDLPELRRFVVRTGGLSADNFAAITRARWPQLEELEIWFGSYDHGAEPVAPPEVAAMLVRLPQLRRLALRNAENTDELVAAVLRSPILPQLRELDLSMGTLSDAGAELLIESVAQLAHLATLDVSENAIPSHLVAVLRRALPNIRADGQKRHRYVSVGE